MTKTSTCSTIGYHDFGGQVVAWSLAFLNATNIFVVEAGKLLRPSNGLSDVVETRVDNAVARRSLERSPCGVHETLQAMSRDMLTPAL